MQYVDTCSLSFNFQSLINIYLMNDYRPLIFDLIYNLNPKTQPQLCINLNISDTYRWNFILFILILFFARHRTTLLLNKPPNLRLHPYFFKGNNRLLKCQRQNSLMFSTVIEYYVIGFKLTPNDEHSVKLFYH